MNPHHDNLEELKRKEAELQAALAEIRREKESVIQSRREIEAEEARKKELEKAVIVSVLQYVHSASRTSLQVQIDVNRSDVRELLGLQSSSEWIRERFIPVVDWAELEQKLLALPHVSIVWLEDSAEKYAWHFNAPAWDIDMAITGEVVCKAGPSEGYRRELNNIPGAKYDYAKRQYEIPTVESWRIPTALQRTEDVIYSEAAHNVIFGELKRRTKLDSIAKQEDCSEEFLGILQQALDRMVWNPRKQIEEPFWEFMMPFQRVNVEFAYNNGHRYLNGDDTGLGKTIEAIALIEVLRWEGKAKQALCAIKAANMANWVREINRFTGIDPFICLTGDPDGTSIVKVIVEKHPYVIISYDTLGSKTYTDKQKNEGFYAWTQIFTTASPDFLILDEAHQIKNPTTHRFRAIKPLAMLAHVIPMTASPVLNRTDELWTLLHMTAPMQFDSFERFKIRYVGNGGSARDVEKLHELIRPIFLRRLKKDVQKDLPPINRINHYHTLTPRAEKLYQKVLAGIYTRLEHYDPHGKGGEQTAVMGILAQITRLKQVCAADKVEYTADIATEIADASEGKKILIFSQFKGTALSIAQRLGDQAVCTVIRTPDLFNSMNATQRDELFESVRDDSNIRFVVTTTAAQEGHNLEFCDFVIFNDLFWTPEGHRQCEGRAYGRLSNPHPIDSYYIVADIEIERWIMELLEKKMEIIEETVDGVEKSRDVFGSVAMELIRKVKDQMLRQAHRRAG